MSVHVLPPHLAPRREAALLAGLIVLFVGLDFAWIELNQRPLMERAYADLGAALRLAGEGRLPFQYPPLVHAWVGAVVEVTGGGLRTAQKALSLLSIPYLVGMWAWGRQVGGSWGGLLLAAASGGAIWFASYSRVLGFEVGATGLVACAMAALHASRGLRRPLPLLLFGLFTGLGMLAKWLFLPFLALPWLCAGAGAVRGGRVGAILLALASAATAATFLLLSPLNTSGHLPVWAPPALYAGWLSLLVAALCLRRAGAPAPGEWNPGAGLAASLAVAVLVCAPWYVYDFRALHHLAVGNAGELNPFWENLQAYGLQIATTGTWAAALLPLGFLAGLSQPRLRLPILVAALSVAAGTVLIAGAGPRFWPRYILPGTPLIVFVTFAPLAAAAARAGRSAAAAAACGVLILAVVQVGGFALRLPQDPPRVREGTSELGRPLHAPPPDGADYPTGEILSALPRPLRGVTVFDLTPGYMPEGSLSSLLLLEGEELDQVDIVSCVLHRAMVVPDQPQTPDVLVVTPAHHDEAWVATHLPGLQGYQRVGRWSSVHPEGWCAYPWEAGAPRCAENGHRIDYLLYHRQASGGQNQEESRNEQARSSLKLQIRAPQSTVRSSPS